MKILIVDDSAVNLSFLRALLTASAHEVVSAFDGLEALEALRRDPCDLIVSDILMPRLDGFQFCRRCHSDPLLRDIPFIFYTGTYTEEADREFALGLGADLFLTKPMDPRELLRIVDEMSAVKERKRQQPALTPIEEEVYLQEYNERLISKLEEKTEELRELNEALRRSEAQLKANYLTQRAVNTLLRVSMEDTPLPVVLERGLQFLLDLPWLGREAKGAVHLIQGEPPVMVLKASAGFAAGWNEEEAPVPRSHPRPAGGGGETTVTRGKGAAGVFFRVPIHYGSRPVGMLTVFPPPGCEPDRQGEEALCLFADTLAGIIIRRRAQDECDESIRKLRIALNATVQALARTVEVRDPCTSGHQRRVSILAYAMAREMGFEADSLEAIKVAGLIHDLGKISVPPEILAKPTRLSPIEFDLIKVHPQAGYDILKDIEFTGPVALIVAQHHERLDGSGYPRGLKGDEICPEARVVAVADVVEAIISHRPYRPANPLEAALREIEENKDLKYDQRAAEVCCRLFREKGFRFSGGQADQGFYDAEPPEK